MTSWCPPPINVHPLPCIGGGGGSPGPVDAVTCCSPSIATTTLCTVDCDPVSLVLRSGCAECGTEADDPEVVGWIDGDGTYTPGPPPSGLQSCDTCGQDGSPTEPCEPVARCPGLVGLSDGETWSPSPATESVNVNVICPPVIVTPCTGDDAVTVNECGSVSWAAPGGPCTPGELCSGFQVEIPAGSSAYISYVTTDCDGGTSP